VSVLACIHHLQKPSLGLAEIPLRAAGLELDERDLRVGDSLPDLDGVDGIITLGGRQSLREIEQHPYLEVEVSWLADAVERNIPTMGICLGGQLLAQSRGAAVRKLPARVIGWPQVRRTEAGSPDPLFGALPGELHVLHWNEDYFEVPAHAIELIGRSDLGGEAIRIGECAWATQFHPEADEEILDEWYRHPEALAQAGVTEEAARAADAEHMPAQRRAADDLFGRFAAIVAGR
jgi:GMP synthase (glutamine-hydrolysing)